MSRDPSDRLDSAQLRACSIGMRQVIDLDDEIEKICILSQSRCLLHGGATHGQHATVRSRLQYAHRSVAPSIELRRPVARWENTTHTSTADGGKQVRGRAAYEYMSARRPGESDRLPTVLKYSCMRMSRRHVYRRVAVTAAYSCSCLVSRSARTGP